MICGEICSDFVDFVEFLVYSKWGVCPRLQTLILF